MSDTSTNGQGSGGSDHDAPTEFSEGFHEDARNLILRYPVARSALLPLLHLVQSEHNYVSEAGVAFCADALGLTKAEVAAVATFYTMYKRAPVGDYLLSVCTNPTCQVAGSQVIFERYEEALGGTSDPEIRVSIEEAECLGICDAAPVVQVNYDMYGPLTDEEADRLLAGCRKGEPPVSSWSGEPAPTFSEVERELSGANDGFGAALVEAARHSIEGYDVTPSYKSGETDIPVTHPGGDRAGHGGAIFAAQFAGEAADDEDDEQDTQPVEEFSDTAEEVADEGGGEAEDIAADAEQAEATEGDDGSVTTGAPSAGGGAHVTDATDATDIPSSVADDAPPSDASILPGAAADPAGVIPDHPLADDAPSSAGEADVPTDDPVPPAPADDADNAHDEEA